MTHAPITLDITLDEVRASVAEALGITTAEIEPDANLIGLGLDSLRIMTLAGRWRRAGVQINFAQLAAEPTPSAWTRLLAAASDDPDRPAGTAAVGQQEGAVSGDDCSPYPLAPMAHAYWAGRQADALGDVGAHLYVEFDGTGVEQDRLREAVRLVAQAHPQLRTRVLPDGTQQLCPAPSTVEVVDLRADDEQRITAELDRLRDQRTHQMLDIAAGRMWDVALTLLPGGASRVHVDVDMIAADAVSYRLLMRDLATAYRAGELSGPSYRYRDYLTRTVEASPDRAVAERYWSERLPELPGAPELPLSAAGRAGTAVRTRRMHHQVDAAGKAAIEAAARARGVTPAMALASVFADTIARWSATERFLLNVPLFDREPVHPDIDDVVGDFTSSVLIDVDGTAPITADTLQHALHRNAAHSAVSGVEVLRMLGRAQGRQVLAPVVYTSAIGLGELFAPEVTETFGEAVNIVSQGPQVLLDAQVTEFGGGLLLNWDIRAEAFEDGVADAMFGYYRDGLAALVSSTGSADSAGAGSAAELPAEQIARRVAANSTDHARVSRSLHGAFFDCARLRPDALAVADDDNPLTYGRLSDAALRVAGALRAHGVSAGDPVAIRLPKGPDQVIATLGALAVGAHYVPVGYAQPAGRRDAIISGAGARVVLDDGTSEDLPDAAVALPLAEALAGEPIEPVPVDPQAVAYVLYTSGSTGVPKGVEVSHDAATNTIDDLIDRFGLDASSRTLAVSALEFDLSVFDLFAPLSTGGAVVTVGECEKADPAAWLTHTLDHAVTVLNAVPAVLDLLLTQCQAQSRTLPELRAVLLGGDRVGVDLVARTAAVAPNARFAGLGGATEAAIHSTVCEVTTAPASWDCVPYGRPLRNVRCRVVDGGGRDRPDHVAGELWIGGRSVALGYRGDPERTADRFVRTGASGVPGLAGASGDEIRWYRTGDRARYDGAGGIEFLGRADNQVKVRGHRVELGDTEAALRSCPGVTGAIARVCGDGARAHLVAAVTVERPGEPSPPEILAAAAAAVPAYMVPARIEVFDEFPLTGNGKIDRQAIGRALESAAEVSASREPSSALERAMLALVAEAIGAEPGAIGVDDDFFGLGGDSVQATALVAAMREWLSAPQVSLADVFAGRTVAGIVAAITKSGTVDAADAAEQTGEAERLEAVAQVYLEVSALSAEELAELMDAETEEAQP